MLNAHCHLELSALKGAIPPGLPFPEWIRRIAALKRAHDPAAFRAAAERALREMAESGTTALLDIVSLPWAAAAHRAPGPARRLLFHELLSLSEALAADVLAAAESAMDAPHARHGLSPHAPYTVTVPLVRGAVEAARRRGAWLCIHVAETAEETEWMLTGDGPFAEVLAPFAAQHGWQPPGMRPLEFLDALGAIGPRTLAVHLNDLDGAELDLLRKRGASAVVCPGTHAYFARGEFPLRRLLDAGIPTYLGSDSLASNESLDMEREARLASELSGLPLHQTLALADPARAAAFF